jgi:exopolyphosphatase/guanosine-5'-triphosphate,3'-diphosphate pyrophosphatase
VVDRVTVIDVGSGSMKASVFAKDDGKVKIVAGISRGTRLCQKIGEDIKPRKIKMTIDFFNEVTKLAQANNSQDIIAVATQAARKAANFSNLQKEISQKTGINLCVISGIAEATLTARGVRQNTNLDQFISLDVGCGSVEIVEFNGKINGLWSLPISALDLCRTREFEIAEGLIRKELEPLHFRNNDIFHFPVVGTGGTLRVANLLLNGGGRGMLSYDQLNNLFETLKNKTESERTALGVPKMRADIFPFGLLIVMKIMEHTKADGILPSNSNLRMSLAVDHFKMLK